MLLAQEEVVHFRRHQKSCLVTISNQQEALYDTQSLAWADLCLLKTNGFLCIHSYTINLN